MIHHLFQKRVLPPFVSKIVIRRLKRKINHSQLVLDDGQFTSYTVSTDKGLLDIELSQQSERLEIEKAVSKLCKAENIPVPKIIFYEKINDSQMPSFIMIKEMKGRPFIQERMHIFDYNRVLSELAELLLRLHRIQLSQFGFLDSDLKAKTNQWHTFLNQDLDEELKVIHKSRIFPKEMRKKIEKNVFFKPEAKEAVFLHGHIATSAIYINDKLKITELTNFTQPLAGDPHYEMAGFLLYEGFDRAKRLTRLYYLLGGVVEWDSPYFLQISLRRVLRSLHWVIKTKQFNLVLPRKEMITQLVARL